MGWGRVLYLCETVQNKDKAPARIDHSSHGLAKREVYTIGVWGPPHAAAQTGERVHVCTEETQRTHHHYEHQEEEYSPVFAKGSRHQSFCLTSTSWRSKILMAASTTLSCAYVCCELSINSRITIKPADEQSSNY